MQNFLIRWDNLAPGQR